MICVECTYKIVLAFEKLYLLIANYPGVGIRFAILNRDQRSKTKNSSWKHILQACASSVKPLP